jgi:CubicO group peptidase (beta-lactamase class C family)
MRRTALTSVLVLLLLPATAPAQVALPPDLDGRLDAIFTTYDSRQSPGCAVGVGSHGRVLSERAWGMADLEQGTTNRPGSIFEAGSVSKQFTAAAIVLLALEGRLSLDDDVRKYVPEVPDYGTPITIRHLLNHTSGLRDWGSVAGIGGWGRGSRVHTHAHMLDIVSRQRALNYEPGAQYSYTNSGYNLMAVIADRVSGMSFADFSRTRIFEPLGLRDTQWRDDYTRIVPGRATAYSARGGGFALAMPYENVHGNGGLLTTVADLIRWDEHVRTGDGLGGPEFVRLMHEQGVLTDGQRISYAAGLQIGRFNGVPSVSHTGSTGGYRAFLARYPDQQLTVALLCNLGSVNPGGVGGQVASIFIPRPATAQTQPGGGGPQAQPPAPPSLSPAQLQAYAGEYHSPDVESTWTVVVEGDQLVLRRRPDLRSVLRPTGADEFAGPGGTLRFHRDAAGRVTQLGISQARVFDLRFDRVR